MPKAFGCIGLQTKKRGCAIGKVGAAKNTDQQVMERHYGR